MNINGSSLEKACDFLLQKDLTLELNGKIFKQGKLVLFYQKNFYLVFVMNTNKRENDKIEIPIPFELETHEEDNLVFFDYRIKTLSRTVPEMENHMRVYPTKVSGNRFWDNILTINAAS